MPLKKQSFLLTFEDGDSTRWLFDAAHIAQTLRCLAGSVAVVNTTGAKPAVKCEPVQSAAVTDAPLQRQ